ncbi:MAG: hypothetical protein HOQ12_16110, partial [Gemmatimonadaceae bacterium]|nr:hypothetical protein [Gemmatimonadaceae bacterium]
MQRRPTQLQATRSDIGAGTTLSREAVMPRGDELNEELLFSDRDDDSDEGGFGGGGSSSFDDDDEEDGGWGTLHKDDSESLWDSTDDVDEDEEEGEVGEVAAEEEEEESTFGRRG